MDWSVEYCLLLTSFFLSSGCRKRSAKVVEEVLSKSPFAQCVRWCVYFLRSQLLFCSVMSSSLSLSLRVVISFHFLYFLAPFTSLFLVFVLFPLFVTFLSRFSFVMKCIKLFSSLVVKSLINPIETRMQNSSKRSWRQARSQQEECNYSISSIEYLFISNCLLPHSSYLCRLLRIDGCAFRHIRTPINAYIRIWMHTYMHTVDDERCSRFGRKRSRFSS